MAEKLLVNELVEMFDGTVVRTEAEAPPPAAPTSIADIVRRAPRTCLPCLNAHCLLWSGPPGQAVPSTAHPPRWGRCVAVLLQIVEPYRGQGPFAGQGLCTGVQPGEPGAETWPVVVAHPAAPTSPASSPSADGTTTGRPGSARAAAAPGHGRSRRSPGAGPGRHRSPPRWARRTSPGWPRRRRTPSMAPSQSRPPCPARPPRPFHPAGVELAQPGPAATSGNPLPEPSSSSVEVSPRCQACQSMTVWPTSASEYRPRTSRPPCTTPAPMPVEMVRYATSVWAPPAPSSASPTAARSASLATWTGTPRSALTPLGREQLRPALGQVRRPQEAAGGVVDHAGQPDHRVEGRAFRRPRDGGGQQVDQRRGHVGMTWCGCGLPFEDLPVGAHERTHLRATDVCGQDGVRRDPGGSPVSSPTVASRGTFTTS